MEYEIKISGSGALSTIAVALENVATAVKAMTSFSDFDGGSWEDPILITEIIKKDG